MVFEQAAQLLSDKHHKADENSRFAHRLQEADIENATYQVSTPALLTFMLSV